MFQRFCLRVAKGPKPAPTTLDKQVGWLSAGLLLALPALMGLSRPPGANPQLVSPLLAPAPPGGALLLGQSAPFSGPSGQLGQEYREGAEAWFAEVNRNGGSLGGNQTFTGTPSTSNAAFALQVGAIGNNVIPLTGYIAEVVIANSKLSTADRQRLEGYLAHKWGLTNNLPAGHPYKYEPPYKVEPEEIVTDGLVLNLDAGDYASYPRSGTTWYDLSGGGNNGTLTNGPTYDSANKGSIVFDGTNDYVSVPSFNADSNQALSVFCWFNGSDLTNKTSSYYCFKASKKIFD